MIHRIVLGFALAASLLPVSGCAYDPDLRGDQSAEQYRTDLAACQQTSQEQVRLKNAATPQSWALSPIYGPPMVRAAIRACLRAKGYGAPKS